MDKAFVLARAAHARTYRHLDRHSELIWRQARETIARGGGLRGAQLDAWHARIHMLISTYGHAAPASPRMAQFRALLDISSAVNPRKEPP